jgi:predicted TIM-barrel fold metal-dependent hydrolase
MHIVDADTHVVEAEVIWDYLDPADRAHRPVTVSVDALPGELKQRAMAGRKFWLVDGRMYGMGGLPSNSYAPGTRDLTDAAARVAHMDALGIDVQVIYPSVFLNLIVKKAEAELALVKAYNRWLADVCRPHGSRLRWLVAVAPRAVEQSVAEIAWGRKNGAVGVLLHGYEGDRTLDNPDFYPLYAKAAELDMPICVHIGTNSPSFQGMEHGTGGRPNIVAVIMPAIVAFSALMLSEVPQKFPTLRFGFIEGGSEWVPFAVSRTRRTAAHFKTKDLTDRMLADNRFYVTCEVHEDLPRILEVAGPDNLVIGTDYGHSDTSTELRAPHILRERNDIPADVTARIVSDNAKRLYGL